MTSSYSYLTQVIVVGMYIYIYIYVSNLRAEDEAD